MRIDKLFLFTVLWLVVPISVFAIDWKILQQPNSIERCPGSTALFNLSLSQEGLQLQWQSSSDGGLFFLDIPGEVNDSLVIYPVKKNFQNYRYRCRVRDTIGNELYSDIVSLTVFDKTLITTHSGLQQLCPGAFSYVSVQASGEQIQYQWWAQDAGKNPVLLQNGQHFEGVSSANMLIKNASSDLYPNYYCRVAGTCGADSSLLIPLQVFEPFVFTLNSQDVTCFGKEDGFVSIDIAHPDQYTYRWSNGNSHANQTHLPSGMYQLGISDGTCSQEDSIEVKQPSALLLDLTVPLLNNDKAISEYGASDGSISPIVAGGTQPYTYAWSTGSTNKELHKLAAGTYHLEVKDANGCTVADKAVLEAPGTVSVYQGISPNGDGKNDFLTIKNIEYYPSNTVEIYNNDNQRLVYLKDYSNDQQWTPKTANEDGFPSGNYRICITLIGAKQSRQIVDFLAVYR